MFDLKLTHASLRLSRPLAAGTEVAQEGLLLCSTLEDGVEKAAIVASPAGGESVIGFSITAGSQPDQTVAVENVTVPATGTYEVQLRNTNLVTARLRAVVVGGSALTAVYCPPGTYAGTTTAGQVKVNLATGQLKFASAQAGASVDVVYSYQLTLLQSQQRFGERFVNNRGLEAALGIVEIGSGLVELYTDQFDSSLDWSSATPSLGPNGIIDGGAGGGDALNAVVISLPSVDNPLLGLRINFEPAV